MAKKTNNCGGPGEPPCDNSYAKKIRSSRKGQRTNSDGSKSTHLMAREYIDNVWKVFPTLFQEGEDWIEYNPNDIIEGRKRGYGEAYQKAKQKKEVYTFDNEQDAINFADKGAWKNQDKMAKKKKKYRTGSGTQGVVRDYLPDPLEINTNAQLTMAKAEAEAMADPFAMGMDMLAANAGNISQAVGGIGVPKAMYGDKKAMYGEEGINVEGNEVVDDPTVGAFEVQGPSHDEGGVDLDVSPETNIFSDKVVDKDGKSMAERKKKREKAMKNLVKMLEEDSLDKPRKNAYKRKLSQLEAEEQKDLEVQDEAGMLAELLGLEHTGADGYAKYGQRKKYAWGSGFNPQMIQALMQATNPNASLESLNQGQDPLKGDNMQFHSVPKTDTTANKASGDMGEGMPLGTPKSGGTGTVDPREMDLSPGMLGNAVKLAGNAFGGISQLMNTEEARAGDMAHPNYSKNVGKDAIATLEGSKGDLDAMKANQQSRVRREAVGNRRRGRASARGVNQMRATDAVTDMQTNMAEMDIFDNVASKHMGIDQSIAQTQMGASQAKAQGAYMARENTDKDRGQYYTNRGVGFKNLSNAIQQTGADINQMAKDPVTMKLINSLSEHFELLRDGTMKQKQ